MTFDKKNILREILFSLSFTICNQLQLFIWFLLNIIWYLINRIGDLNTWNSLKQLWNYSGKSPAEEGKAQMQIDEAKGKE